jgi:hypothetical protein
MATRKKHFWQGDPSRSEEESQRERIVHVLARRWQLDRLAKEVLREIVAQSSVRKEPNGKFKLQLPDRLTVDQQLRVVRPLRKVAREDADRIAGQLEGIGTVGERLGKIVRGSLAHPLVALAGKSPFDGYLALCSNSGMHWGIVRALQHLRDAITVTKEPFFTNPAKLSIHWILHVDRITAAMLRHVEECLRTVDARALHDPACERWLKGIQTAFDQIKSGVFRLPGRAAAAEPPDSDALRADGGTGKTADQSLPIPPEPAEDSDNSQGWRRGLQQALRALRQHLLPHYLDLLPDDFATLCRLDHATRDFGRRLEGAVERFCTDCWHALRQSFIEAGLPEVSGVGAPDPSDGEIGQCVRQLAVQTASFRQWLSRELPQGSNTIGRQLVELAESSLVSGLFFEFLQRRQPELFRELRDEDHVDVERRAARDTASSQIAAIGRIEASLKREGFAIAALVEKGEAAAVAIEVVKYCEAAIAELAPLLALASQGKAREAEPAPCSLGRIAQRCLSAESVYASAPEGFSCYIELVEYEPGWLPSLRCEYWATTNEQSASWERVKVCRFSRRRGIVLSSTIAIPVSALFGEDSKLGRLAGFLDLEIDRHLAELKQLGGSNGVRQCLPYVKNQGAQLARIQVRAEDSDSRVTLVAMPSSAMALSKDFAESVTMRQALEQARAESPAQEALLRAVESRWRERGISHDEYSLCVVGNDAPVAEESEIGDEGKQSRRVRRFLNQKARWPLHEVKEILGALGIVLEAKADGAPHGKVRLEQRHHTLSSKLLKDKQVYATYLYEWIRALGQERRLADLLQGRDPRLVSYMRKADREEE